MRINREYEVEISLKDLLFDILYHWRSCVLAALALAVLLGGLGYASNLKSNHASPAVEAGTGLEASNAGNYQESADLYARLLRGYDSYRNRSFLMQADPYQIWTVNAVYYVRTSEQQGKDDAADAAVYSYASAVYSELDTDRLQKIYGDVDVNYLEEFIVVESDLAADCFSLKVRGLTAEMAENAFAYVDENLRKFSTDHAEVLPEHQLFRLTRYTSAGTDRELEDHQVTMAGNISKYIAGQSASEQAAESWIQDRNVPHPLRSVLKKALIGFLIGGFLAVCFHAVRYLLSDRLHRAQDLSDAFGIPLYNELPHSRARRPGKGVDGLLEKWEFGPAKNQSIHAFDEIQSLLAEKHANQKVLLTGSITEKDLIPFAEALQEKCGNTCEISFQPNFLRNKSAVQACSTADSIILVEKKGISSNQEIARMVDMLLICKSNVEGFVLL